MRARKTQFKKPWAADQHSFGTGRSTAVSRLCKAWAAQAKKLCILRICPISTGHYHPPPTTTSSNNQLLASFLMTMNPIQSSSLLSPSMATSPNRTTLVPNINRSSRKILSIWPLMRWWRPSSRCILWWSFHMDSIYTNFILKPCPRLGSNLASSLPILM